MTSVRVDCPVATDEGAAVHAPAERSPRSERQRPTPVPRQRDFGLDEMFFSTTDGKGRITSGNRVFERVSGYGGTQLVGRPHNLVRHPDMPRAVFQLLWDYLQAGRPIAAYVKNLAADGAYYWVLATALPVQGGYLSVRIKPSAPYLALVEAAYGEVLALERSLEAEGATRKEAIALTLARLGEIVVDAGFRDYESFMGAALAAELTSRELGRTARPGPSPGQALRSPELAEILDSCSAVEAHMHTLFAALEGFGRVNETLVGKAAFVLQLADSVRLLALNAMIAAARLEREGDVLGAVARMLGARSHAIARVVGAVSEDLDEILGLLDRLEFRVALAKLQTEMTACFARELDETRDEGRSATGRGVEDDLALLARCLRAGAEEAFDSLRALDGALARVGGHVGRLTSGLKALGALQTGGRIEATRTDAASFILLFREVSDQVAAARVELAEVERIARESRAVALSRGELRARDHLARIDARAAGLVALTRSPR
ncbi:MAG: PAS domain-containing protein [Thermoleophilia bacterium]